jgi:hypothetical protein
MYGVAAFNVVIAVCSKSDSCNPLAAWFCHEFFASAPEPAAVSESRPAC